MSRHTNPAPLAATEPAVELIGVATPTVASELRRRRELLGWSQAEAARRSGVSRTVINEIEAGKRMLHTGTYEKLRGARGGRDGRGRSAGTQLPAGHFGRHGQLVFLR
jgi:DNA-binding XRE family transcriptional regulator